MPKRRLLLISGCRASRSMVQASAREEKIPVGARPFLGMGLEPLDERRCLFIETTRDAEGKRLPWIAGHRRGTLSIFESIHETGNDEFAACAISAIADFQKHFAVGWHCPEGMFLTNGVEHHAGENKRAEATEPFDLHCLQPRGATRQMPWDRLIGRL